MRKVEYYDCKLVTAVEDNTGLVPYRAATLPIIEEVADRQQEETMENGFYRCTNSDVSTADWVTLNFVPINTRVFGWLADNENIVDMLTRIDSGEEPDEPTDPYCEPVEPTREEYYTGIAFDEAHEDWKVDHQEWQEKDKDYDAWKDAHDEWEADQDLLGYPAAWGTMWAAARDDDLIKALIDSGFVVYETTGNMEDFGEIIFGVDGAGYDFYGAHWVPLRARLARSRHDAGYLDEKALGVVLESLTEIVRNAGDSPEKFLAQFGVPQ